MDEQLHFFDGLSITELFDKGCSTKGTPLISYEKMLDLHEFAKSNGYYVASLEPFEIKNDLEYSDLSKNLSEFYGKYDTKRAMISAIDADLREIGNLITKEGNPYGFQVYLDNSFE